MPRGRTGDDSDDDAAFKPPVPAHVVHREDLPPKAPIARHSVSSTENTHPTGAQSETKEKLTVSSKPIAFKDTAWVEQEVEDVAAKTEKMEAAIGERHAQGAASMLVAGNMAPSSASAVAGLDSKPEAISTQETSSLKTNAPLPEAAVTAKLVDSKMPAVFPPGAVAMGAGSGLDPAAVKQAAAIDPSRLLYASGSGSVTASGRSNVAAAARTIREEEKEEITASSCMTKPGASRTGSRAIGAVAVAGMGGPSNTETIEENDDGVGEDSDLEPNNSASLPAAEAVSAELVDNRPQPQDLEAQVQARVQDQVQRFLESTQVAQVEPIDEKPARAGGQRGNKKKTYITIGVVALAIIGGVIGAVVALTGGDDPSPAPPTDSPINPDELEKRLLREVLFPTSGDSLDVPGSPQNQAMTWMLTEDPGKLDFVSSPNNVIRLRYAATVIYFSFEGENWLSQLNFLTEGSICTWFQGGKGIICERNTDEATQLVLSENSLGGQIPSEISVFSNLEEIDLNMNEIFGSIPNEIFFLRGLKNFYASSNDLTGTIPDNIGNATNLELFFAEKNDLNGSLPVSVGKGVGALRAVALSDNSITGTIPDFASNSSRDDFFAILASRNRLRGPIPASFGALPKLAMVALTDNFLTGTLPDFSANQNTFQGLQVNLNRLTGNISNFFETVPPGKVTTVWFDDNLLGGTIPTQIGLFTSLTDLRMNGNSNIEGTIPSEIGLLTKLSSALWLDENRITGQLPSEIGSLTSLILLATRKNQLTGEIPEELANCRGLRILDLSDNMMTGNVSSLVDTITRDLVRVDFDQNMFTGTIPASIGELNKLAFFDLGVNNINGTLPTELGLLTAMSSLSFLQNDMVGTIPSQLGLMTTLTSLSLGGNMFTGTVPTQLAQLTKLDQLTLQDNDLTGNVDAICDAGIPFSIFAVETCGDQDNQALLECGCCTHCCEIDSFNCQSLYALREVLFPISGDSLDVPGSPQFRALNWMASEDPLQLTLGTATSRQIIERYVVVLLYYSTNGASWTKQYNFLTGTPVCSWNDGTSGISKQGVFCDLNGAETDDVTNIILGENNLIGSLPSEFTSLESLIKINLVKNSLHGTIPDSVSRLRQLEYVDLAGNSMSGTIPSAFFELSRLFALSLDDNEVTGSLPENVGNARSLQFLWCTDCTKLEGSIPDSITQIDKLMYLVLERSLLTGTVPALTCPDLLGLGLSGNALTGTIPASLGLLSNLQQLSLKSNFLNGTIPDLARATSLTHVQLHENELTGNIERILSTTNVVGLEELNLNTNRLTGSIPTSIGLYTDLSYLGLGVNKLRGRIPTQMGLLSSSMETVYLYDSQLTGTLPTEFGLLARLQLLNAGINEFVGKIPSELGHLGRLEYLSLWNNQFTGAVPNELAALPELESLYLAFNMLTGDLDAFCTRGDPIDPFYADCLGNPPEIECSCCTHCCSDVDTCEEAA